MNILVTFFLTLAFSYGISGDDKVRYDGFKVYRLTPKSEEAVEVLKVLEESNAYDFWTGVRGVGYPVDVMVPPHYKYRFNDTISLGEFDTEVFIADVQKLIDNERPKTRNGPTPFALEWTEDYHTLEEINQWLTEIATDNPDIVTLVTVGESYEGRDIVGVRLSFNPDNEARTVFLEANIHAREWITSAVVTWIVNQFLTSEDPDVRQVAESHDWIVVPVFNPDGFEYSHTTDRMWRKTRTPYFFCVGADPNRNWGHHYDEGGTSINPCSETYRGPNAFSETSTRTISEFIDTPAVGPNLLAYISIHSYSQMLLLPFGYSYDHLANYDELFAVGTLAAESLAQRYGTRYQVGNIPETLYVASGGSMDWVKGVFGTRITYSYELRDTGEFGFLLPADQIIECAEETLDSLVTIFQEFDNL